MFLTLPFAKEHQLDKMVHHLYRRIRTDNLYNELIRNAEENQKERVGGVNEKEIQGKNNI